MSVLIPDNETLNSLMTLLQSLSIVLKSKNVVVLHKKTRFFIVFTYLCPSIYVYHINIIYADELCSACAVTGLSLYVSIPLMAFIAVTYTALVN